MDACPQTVLVWWSRQEQEQINSSWKNRCEMEVNTRSSEVARVTTANFTSESRRKCPVLGRHSPGKWVEAQQEEGTVCTEAPRLKKCGSFEQLPVAKDHWSTGHTGEKTGRWRPSWQRSDLYSREALWTASCGKDMQTETRGKRSQRVDCAQGLNSPSLSMSLTSMHVSRHILSIAFCGFWNWLECITIKKDGTSF